MRGNFVVLRAGDLRLLLRQEEVGAAEYADAKAPASGVVALSGRMRPMAQLPEGRFVLTRLEHGADAAAFAWDEVKVMIDADLQARPLPPSMRTKDAPIEGYVVHEGELLLCTNARHLLADARG